jgi:hypothetical protein
MRVGQRSARAAQIANAALGARGRVRFDEKTGKVEAI